MKISSNIFSKNVLWSIFFFGNIPIIPQFNIPIIKRGKGKRGEK